MEMNIAKPYYVITIINYEEHSENDTQCKCMLV